MARKHLLGVLILGGTQAHSTRAIRISRGKPGPSDVQSAIGNRLRRIDIDVLHKARGEAASSHVTGARVTDVASAASVDLPPSRHPHPPPPRPR
ncbi:unnamed protein product, partial [Iphiclides podalirius]